MLMCRDSGVYLLLCSLMMLGMWMKLIWEWNLKLLIIGELDRIRMDSVLNFLISECVIVWYWCKCFSLKELWL